MQLEEKIIITKNERNRQDEAVPFLCLSVILVAIVTTFTLYGCGRAGDELVLVSEESGIAIQEETAAFCDDEENRIIVEQASEEQVLAVSDTISAQVSEMNEKCYVHVCGAVAAPNVYELDYGSRIVDAVLLAGGFTDEADADYINLAQKVSDGMRIYIPVVGEVINTPVSSEMVTDSNDYTSGGVASSTGNAGAKLVNINTADEGELMTLPGIGQSKASKIIAYREKNGAFGKISDIMNVDGIKNGMYDKIKELITVN